MDAGFRMALGWFTWAFMVFMVYDGLLVGLIANHWLGVSSSYSFLWNVQTLKHTRMEAPASIWHSIKCATNSTEPSMQHKYIRPH